MQVRLKFIPGLNTWSPTQLYSGCAFTLRPYMKRNGSLYTGLSKEDVKRLSDALGLDLRPTSSFWDTFSIAIGKEVVALETDDPQDEVKYLFLKSHKLVKQSIAENKAGALFYLHNDEEEADIFNKYNRRKREAIVEFNKLKPSDIKKALRLYGQNANNMSDAVAEDKLFRFVESNPDNFFRIWVDNKNKKTEYLIKEAIAKGIIRKNKNIHYFGTVTLGNTLEDAIAYIDNKENSDIKASIINEANID